MYHLCAYRACATDYYSTTRVAYITCIPIQKQSWQHNALFPLTNCVMHTKTITGQVHDYSYSYRLEGQDIGKGGGGACFVALSPRCAVWGAREGGGSCVRLSPTKVAVFWVSLTLPPPLHWDFIHPSLLATLPWHSCVSLAHCGDNIISFERDNG